MRHGDGDVADALGHLAAEERGVALGDGDGAGHHAGVADLPPVVGRSAPPGVGTGGEEALFPDGVGDEVAVRRGEVVVEPVVSRRDGQSHLGNVQEVGRIPVLEAREGAQLLDAAVPVGGVASHAEAQSKRGDAVHLKARDGEEPAPLHHALRGRDAENSVCEEHEAVEHPLVDSPGGGLPAQRLELLRSGE